MSEFPRDIYTEPSNVDVDTLKNLGPLSGMAGIWQGIRGLDVKPKADGARKQAYVERIELQPIDPVTNGPQLLYGLRYYTHITKPDQVKTYHEQVGYWLWEPATGTITHTLTIPRGQTVMAAGQASADAKSFELVATQGPSDFGICSAPFLQHAFRTVEFRVQVTINDDGTWTYDEDTVMKIQGQDELFHHTDRNVLGKIGEPTPNPLARALYTA
ncbi:MAG: heme-binding beta-barrel domain-containing protein [Aquabacterium sp.]